MLYLVLFVGVAGYFVWRHHFSSLSRDCRWRLDRAGGVWRCAACGGELPDGAKGAPRICLKNND
ncbi:hypothetical protein [Aquicoccus sp. SU-CL01552]|uniref:hypothetical protein n=1 Tax=Aquicoccus sp. SU-CL01552 TaxID=3127656 RepID=UPI00310C807E